VRHHPQVEGKSVLTVGYLPLREAGRWAGVSQKTMQRWIKKGLPYHQAGPREKVLIRPADIEAFLTRRQAVDVNLSATVDDVFKSLMTGAA